MREAAHYRGTMAERILSRKVGRQVWAGEFVVAAVDGAMASDVTGPQAIKSFEALGDGPLFDPERVSLVIDHAAPAPNERVAALHQRLRRFAEEKGCHLYEVGEGICHQLMIEDRRVRPGELFIGADSHSCTYGAVAAFGTGVGSTDLAAIMHTGKTWLRVPETIRVEVEGALPKNCSAKDLTLYIVGTVGLAGATYQALEYHGEAIEAMSLDSRMTLANMTVEMGGKVGLVSPRGLRGYDEVLADGGLEALLPSADARYHRTLNIDAGALTPQISLPSSPDRVRPLAALPAGKKISYGFIGTCANGRLEDLREAARILAGQRLARGVRLLIAPASKQVFKEALLDGTAITLMEAGATFIASGCGPCVGTHQGVPGQGEVVISTANRNFPGRMGNRGAEVYLASPAMVAASVLKGEICAEEPPAGAHLAQEVHR